MMDNKTARKEVRLLKAMNDITYGEFAEMVGLSKNSVYCWINNQFDLGDYRLGIVDEVITNLKGE